MDHVDLDEWSKRATDRAHAYHKGLRDQPVRARPVRGAIAEQLQKSPPEKAETIEKVFANFESIVLGGRTNWQTLPVALPKLKRLLSTGCGRPSVYPMISPAPFTTRQQQQHSALCSPSAGAALDWQGLTKGMSGAPRLTAY